LRAIVVLYCTTIIVVNILVIVLNHIFTRSIVSSLRHLIDQKSYKLPQLLVLSFSLLSLSIVGLVQVKQTPLLLEMIVVEAIDRVEVVGR